MNNSYSKRQLFELWRGFNHLPEKIVVQMLSDFALCDLKTAGKMHKEFFSFERHRNETQDSFVSQKEELQSYLQMKQPTPEALKNQKNRRIS